MKRMLLAAAAALALATGTARAQLSVYDLKGDVARAAEAVRSIQQMVQQYRMLESTYNAIAHATDVRGVAAALGGPARMYFPEVGQIPGLIAGSGSLYGAANGLIGMSRYLDVGEDSPWAREMQRRERATANLKAMALGGMESAQTSIGGLMSLLDRLSGSQDGTEVAAVNGALAVEQQNISHHQAQVAQLQLMLGTEDRSDRQRAEQMRYESASELYDATAGGAPQ